MIITKLVGGLGNQMFQYAIARTYQRKKSEEIIFDTRLLKRAETDIEKITLRPYALNIFENLKALPIDKRHYQIYEGTGIVERVRRRIYRYNTTHVQQPLMILPEGGYAYSTDPVPFTKTNKRNIYLEGNFQSELYFKHMRKELLEDFSFPALDEVNEHIKSKILETPNALSLHIRRGDYLSALNRDTFASVNLNYYRKALANVQAYTGTERLNTFIFTDDVQWVRQHFKYDKQNFHFVEGNEGENSWKDMYLMSCCQHHIIANSTFSWWGAWLSQGGGIKLAPRYWFRPNTIPYAINHIIPESWTIIDYEL